MRQVFDWNEKIPNTISVPVLIWGFLFSILVFILYKAETEAQDLALLFDPHLITIIEFTD